MKKFLSLMIVTILIGAMLIVQLPTVALAANFIDIVKELRTKKTSKGDDGQVIIMYNDYSTSSTSALKKSKQKSILSELNIEKTLDFEDVRIDKTVSSKDDIELPDDEGTSSTEKQTPSSNEIINEQEADAKSVLVVGPLVDDALRYSEAFL